jgi:AcrR family transcriptional regulator
MDIKNKLLNRTYDLYMRYGIKSVSMDDIAKSLGMSKKTIYTYIKNKDDLVHQVITKHLSEDEAEIKGIVASAHNAIEEMIEISRHTLSFLRNMKPSVIYDLKKYHPESWKLIDEKHFQHVHDVISNNIRRGITEGLYREDINPGIIATFYARVTEIVVDESIFPLKEFRHHELFISHVNYHMRGIVNEKGKTMFKEISLN